MLKYLKLLVNIRYTMVYYSFTALEQFDVSMIVPMYLYIFDISITNLVAFFFLFSFLIWVCVSNFIIYLVPNSVQIFFELILKFVGGVVDQQVGVRGYKYLPFFFLIFSFILVFNFVSLMPFSFAPTSHIVMTLVLALGLCSGIFFIGILNHGIK